MPIKPLAVGDIIHGFAYGVFGRDHYDCVRIEAVGPDWIVARNPHDEFDDGLSFVSGSRSLKSCIQARDEPCSGGPCSLAQIDPPLTDLTSNR
jgi:hypothetical protein